MTKDILKLEQYTPGELLDEVIHRFKLRNDAKLAKIIGISSPAISRMRNKKLVIGGDTIIRIYDKTGMDIDEIRMLAGIPTHKNIVDEDFKDKSVVENV